MATIHVVGGGLSGLAAASALAAEHLPVKLYEATASAGGRARSSTQSLGVLDHGLHLIPGHARETFRFLERIGARDRLLQVMRPYSFANLHDGSRWQLSRWRPLPAAPLADYWAFLRMLFWPERYTAGHFLSAHNRLREHWGEIIARMQLHTPLDEVSARSMRRSLRTAFGKLYMPRHSLRETFLEPSLHFLEEHGASVYFSHTLTGLGMSGKRITSLNFSRKQITLTPKDIIIIAGPPALAASLWPKLEVPKSTHSAITLHYRAEHTEKPGSVRFLSEGLIDMLRYDEGIIHATIRVAGKAWDVEPQLLAKRCWQQLRVLHRPLRRLPMPEWSIWREKRAGHLLDLATARMHPIDHRPHPRCILAGDWLYPSAPASIESAIRSGHEAAKLAKVLRSGFTERRQTY